MHYDFLVYRNLRLRKSSFFSAPRLLMIFWHASAAETSQHSILTTNTNGLPTPRKWTGDLLISLALSISRWVRKQFFVRLTLVLLLDATLTSQDSTRALPLVHVSLISPVRCGAHQTPNHGYATDSLTRTHSTFRSYVPPWGG